MLKIGRCWGERVETRPGSFWYVAVTSPSPSCVIVSILLGIITLTPSWHWLCFAENLIEKAGFQLHARCCSTTSSCVHRSKKRVPAKKIGFSSKNWRRTQKVWSLHCLHCPVELTLSFHQNYGQLLLKYCINIVSIFCKIPLSISIFSKLFSKIFLVIYRYFVTKNSIYSVNYTYIMQLSLKIGLLFKVAFIAYT